MAEPVDLEAVKAELRDEQHVIDLREYGWTIRHTLTCRSIGLFDCPITQAAEVDLQEPPPEVPGRYVVDLDGDGYLVIGDRVTVPEQGVDVAAIVAELEELRGRYGRGDEVWCGARRDQAGSAYCTEMAGHEQHGHPHLWSWERWSWERKALEGR